MSLTYVPAVWQDSTRVLTYRTESQLSEAPHQPDIAEENSINKTGDSVPIVDRIFTLLTDSACPRALSFRLFARLGYIPDICTSDASAKLWKKAMPMELPELMENSRVASTTSPGCCRPMDALWNCESYLQTSRKVFPQNRETGSAPSSDQNSDEYKRNVADKSEILEQQGWEIMDQYNRNEPMASGRSSDLGPRMKLTMRKREAHAL